MQLQRSGRSISIEIIKINVVVRRFLISICKVSVLSMRYRALSSRGVGNASAFFAGVMAALTLGAIGSARATTIDLDLGTSPHISSEVVDSFDVFDGKHLQRQTLSLDFTFSHGEFVRLFTSTSTPFIALLRLQTNGTEFGNFGGTGFLVDQHGNPLQPPQQLGIASGNNGLLGASLHPLLPGDLQRPLDFFGIHFDLMLPLDPLVSITGEQFWLMSERPFGVGPGVPSDFVPDSGSTLLLFGIASFGLLALRQTRRPI